MHALDFIINFIKIVLAVAVGMNGSLSSIYGKKTTVTNAVDNVIECTNYLLTAHTLREFQPWLKIDLQAIHDVKKVIIYNRQDCCGIYFNCHLLP